MSNLIERMRELLWLDPTIPINLAKLIRQDQAHLLPDELDKLLPTTKFNNIQVEQVKEIIRNLEDLDSIEFNEIEEHYKISNEILGDYIDPEFENTDPKLSKLNQNLHLLQVKFGEVDIKNFAVKKPNNVKFAKSAFQRPDPLVLVDNNPTEAYSLLLRRWDQSSASNMGQLRIIDGVPGFAVAIPEYMKISSVIAYLDSQHLDMSYEQKILILFVHGFLGSESSFSSFPLDLVQSVRSLYGIPNLEARVFPFFPTKGDPNKAINFLYNWLLMNATYPEYEAVIIMCHSMGGLIAADAWRKIQKLQSNDPIIPDTTKEFQMASAEYQISKEETELLEQKEEEKINQANETIKEQVKEKDNSGWFGGWWSSKSEEEKLEQVMEPVKVDINAPEAPSPYPKDVELFNNVQTQLRKGIRDYGKAKINLVALISFDSPFYGLNSNVFTFAAGEHAADIISSYVPESHSSQVNSTLKYGSNLASKTFVSSMNVASQLPSLASSAIYSGAQTAKSIPSALYSTAAAIPGAASTVISTSTELPKTIYSKLPTKAEAVEATTATVAAIPSAVSYTASLVTSVPGSLSSLWRYGSNSTIVEDKDANDDIKSELKTELKTEGENEKSTKETDEFSDKVELDGEIITKESANMQLAIKTKISNEEFERAELLPIEEGYNWTPWVTLGLTTAAVVGGAYYSGGILALGTMTLVRRVALAYAVSHASEATHYLRFLYPLWGESQADADKRIEDMKKKVDEGTFFFKAYYIQILPENEDPDGRIKTFVKPPPTATGYLFQPIGSDTDNEIAAHMHMFDRQSNPGSYWNTIHQVGRDVANIVKFVRE
ncbi:hypothetical protein HDV01_001283 [Terramyces sp. JEL0728]|nr:hypothetical protein HDV01_001283 [Terramyces sp. JEL0728]